ncbi:MAG: hypothetical protein F4X44_14145 [Gammaproteobacteria bacterium]|nr:hypothetical protein [Gammaproteobacteria bacterium]MYD81739.1 hypothetical protein [Gammaproteobacteria bacterium]
MNVVERKRDSPELDESGLVHDFAVRHPQEFARVLSRFDSDVAVQVLTALPTESLVPIAAHLSQENTTSIFEMYDIEQLAQMLDSASMDDASRIVYRLAAIRRTEVLALVSNSRKSRVLSQFARLEANTVGEIADKDFLWFPGSMSVGQVRRAIQSATDRDAVESAIVLNDDETVLGLLDYISLTQAESNGSVSNCVEQTTLVPAEARPHAVVYFDDWHRVNRLPIVDHNLIPIGVLRWSQLAELADSPSEEETSESFSIVYEILDAMIELGRSLLSLPGRR